MTTGLQIGSVILDTRAVVAPMVGITDVPFRRLCRDLGAGLVSTEMVAAEAVVRSTQAANRLLEFPPDVRPVAAQLVGHDPGAMAEAAQIAVERGAMIVDVNLGCPVRKVVGMGSGAGLARDIGATVAVLSRMVDAVAVPVTAKMRLGWDHDSINAPELARALQDVGVAAVSVHGRTRCQAYTGFADWDEIARVREAVSIPVLGSGDVVDAAVACRMVREGRVDGVIVARGMLGDPWLLHQCAVALAGGTPPPAQPFADRIALVRRHIGMLVEYWGERRAMKIGRKYIAWTIRGCAGAARLRARVQDLDHLADAQALLAEAMAAGPGPNGPFRPIFTSGDG